MAKLRGFWRCGAMVFCMVIGFVIVALTGWLRLRGRGNSTSAWVVTGLARIFAGLFGLRITCPEPERLRNHVGFIFPNHTGFLDIVALLSVTPMRFLAAAENRKRPLIGYFAEAIDTVFVDRNNKGSRSGARDAIAKSFQASPTPPIVLFPEGKLGPGHHLLPFFFGSFEIAIQNQVSYLPCALRFSHPHISTWGYGGQNKESILTAIWRVATFAGPLTVAVIPLTAVAPQPDDLPARLANETKDALEAALGFEHSSDEMPEVVTFG